MHCIRIALSNHILLVAMHGMALYMAGLDYSFMNLDPVIPSLRTFAVDFVFALLAREMSFYYIHRALHHASIYVYIHKIHHKYITPVAFTAEYAHPVEHILTNVLPISLPLYLKGAHALSIMAFVTFEL
jgi:sterol desaturase/sphingolipid hydroxylase (fatty acid hydroxylase superfamily)